MTHIGAVMSFLSVSQRFCRFRIFRWHYYCAINSKQVDFYFWDVYFYFWDLDFYFWDSDFYFWDLDFYFWDSRINFILPYLSEFCELQSRIRCKTTAQVWRLTNIESSRTQIQSWKSYQQKYKPISKVEVQISKVEV